MYSLASTINDLGARRQSFKRNSECRIVSIERRYVTDETRVIPSHPSVFVRLQYVLFASIFVIFLFFVASAVSFSSRLRSSFPSKTWKHRWLVVEGWSSILYGLVFIVIAILWRPSPSNRKLALASDDSAMMAAAERDTEDEAGMYDVDALLPRGEGDDDDAGADELKDTYPMRRRRSNSSSRGPGGSRDEVVFEVGSDDDEGDRHVRRDGGTTAKSRYEQGGDVERERLRYSDDRQLDITTQHEDMSPTSFDAPPPEYRRSNKDD